MRRWHILWGMVIGTCRSPPSVHLHAYVLKALSSPIQSTLVISTSLISNNRLYRSENLVPVWTWKSNFRGNKILWKRREIAPKGHFLLFSTIFSIISGVSLHIHLWNVVVRFTFSLILQIWYVEVRITRGISESPFDFKITSVDSIK